MPARHRGETPMQPSRRDLFRLGALAAAAVALPTLAQSAAKAPVERAARPLRILILGGTGFTSPSVDLIQRLGG